MPESIRTQHSRREILRLGAGAVLGAALAPARLGAMASEAEFSFVVVNDLHYRDARCGPWFERVVASIRRQRPHPAFVMLAGDLSESGTVEQLGAVREIFHGLPCPVRSVVGNHDCDDAGDFSAYRKVYGPRFNDRFEHAGWQFLSFDSTQGSSVYRTRISEDTLGWLDRTLRDVSRDRPLVLLTHFPLGRNWLRPMNAHTVIERLRGYQFEAALGGHWHGITERDQQGAHLSTNRCCSWWRTNHDGSPLKGYALCRVCTGRIYHEFVAVA
jgi:predicted MPP superfamily phosphohydrolase